MNQLLSLSTNFSRRLSCNQPLVLLIVHAMQTDMAQVDSSAREQA